MSEVKPVHRYKAQTLFSFGGAKIEYFPHGPDVVLATEFDAQRLRADTAEAERDALRYKAELYDEVWADATGRGYANVTMALCALAAAEQRIASIAGKPGKCKECGGDALFWFDSNTNTSGIMEGRLRTNEVTCTFVLGCADCSATIKTVRAETIAARMTAALNPNPEAGSQ
ncbi:MAG: hypothetical protein RR740_09100 [Pseudomonas sp.]